MESKLGLRRPQHNRSRKLEQYPHNPSTPHSTYGVPMPLNLGHKVFLSYSCKDKQFVQFLYEALCRRYHDTDVAFFDVETLPKAEAISMKNILEEARQSKLGVLVLTEDFFTHTRNPMLELEEFVAGNVKLLPLFLTMSVNEFKEEERRARWEKKWREWFAVDDNLVIEKWRNALDVVSMFSGLEYCKTATNQADYIDKVVKAVTRIIGPANPYSKEGVCGKDRLCKIVDYMYKECASKHSLSIDRMPTQVASATSASSGLEENSGYTLDVVGIYGFPGLGKTTLCECLCDFYFAEFNGKVCYVDLGSLPSYAQASPQSSAFSMRMQHMLSKLTGYKNGGQSSRNFSQEKNLLRNRFSKMKDPVFLAIDNILPEWESQDEAAFYLKCKFPKGSKIFITSSTESILNNLTRWCSNFSVVIEYMPALELEEAKAFFVSEISVLSNDGISNEEVELAVNGFVNMCTTKRDRCGVWYHPLLLKSLAAFIRWDKMRNQDWKGKLTKLRSEGMIDSNDTRKMVFNRLDANYELLSEEAQKVFLDLVLYCSATRNRYVMHKWIEIVQSHLRENEMDEIISQLQDLCFIEEKPDEKEQLVVLLDLVVDFGKYKAGQGGVNAEYLVVEDGAHWPNDSRRSARTVSISRCGNDMTESWTLDLREMEGVRVLHIVDNARLQEVLFSGTTCAHLRSLIVWVPSTGTSLYCTSDEGIGSSMSANYTGQCRRWAQSIDLRGDVHFRSSRCHLQSSPRNGFAYSCSLKALGITSAPEVMDDLGSVLGGLRNLEFLHLSSMPGVKLGFNVTACTNLKVLTLFGMPMVTLISVGCENSPHLYGVNVIKNEEVLALVMPAVSKTLDFGIYEGDVAVGSFYTFTLSWRYKKGAHSGTVRGDLFILTSALNVDSHSQYYSGSFDFQQDHWRKKLRPQIVEVLLRDAGIDSSICEAAHMHMQVDCGCDQIVPHLHRLPTPATYETKIDDFLYNLREYRCPQVRGRDVSVARQDTLRMFILRRGPYGSGFASDGAQRRSWGIKYDGLILNANKKFLDIRDYFNTITSPSRGRSSEHSDTFSVNFNFFSSM